MKNPILLLLAVVFVACSQPSQGPTPTPTSQGSASVTPPAIPGLPPLPADIDEPVPPKAPVKPFAPKVDTRTEAQKAAAACNGANGWSCPAIKRPLMASGGNGTAGNCGPACTVPDWYLDFANTSACASDANSGTSATCTGAGIGPLLHISQLYARWGSHSPFLVSSTGVTTLHVLSSQPIGSATADPWGNFNPIAPDGMIEVIGTLAPVGASFTIGAVTQISRANPGNDFQVAGMPGGAAAGQILFDSTAQSYTWVDSVGGGTATCTNPMSAALLTTPVNNPAFSTSGDGGSWTGASDTAQLSTVPTIYVDLMAPAVGSLSAVGGTSGMTWLQWLNFADASGVVGNSVTTLGSVGPITLSMVRADTQIIIDRNNGFFSGQGANIAQDWFQGSGQFQGNACDFYSGAVATGAGVLAPIFGSEATIRIDTIVHGSPVLFGTVQNYNVHYPGGTVTVEPGSALVLRSANVGTVWGATTLRVDQGAAMVNRSPGTWAANVLVNAFQLKSTGVTTGSTPPTAIATFTMNGVTEVPVPSVAGTFPINAPIWWSLATVGGTPCLANPPYFDKAQATGQFYVKSVTVNCNDVYNWQAGQVNGVTITAAAIDNAGAIFDGPSGARYTN